MKVLICEEARPLIEEYHDEQLPVGDQIAVRAHLEWCDDCAEIFADLGLMRGFVRATSPGRAVLDHEDRGTFQATVISRARAEARMSWSTRIREVMDDMHIVYAGFGAAAATVFCIVVMMSMMRFATQERPDSLAAIARMLASPKTVTVDENAPGTNKNPMVVDARMLMPRALDQLFLAAASASDETAFTLSAVVTREGRLVNLEWHSPSGRTPKAGSREAETVDTLLNTASLARFAPARVQGLPIAVNMVWLVANTTVRAPKASTLELPVGVSSPPRKRRVDVALPQTPRRSSVA
ncbi:MAG: zf-HC2 domain-containing protein [Vicinamibacterales bacterium]